MRTALWLVTSLSVISLLVIGSFGFLGMLVALNGVSEARGGPLVITYLVLLLALLVFVLWASRWSLQRLAKRTAWSLWVSAPLAIVATVALATAILAIGFFGLVLLGVS
jgi:EamA domain-containing membrane protein RarD